MNSLYMLSERTGCILAKRSTCTERDDTTAESSSSSFPLLRFLNCAYCLCFKGVGPSWMYTFGGVTILMYANLDSLDGKQARRTGSSSPLGQLFDHGVDAYVVHLMIAGIMTCAGQSCGVRAMMGTAAVRSRLPLYVNPHSSI